MTMVTNVPNSATGPIGRKFAAYVGHCINTWMAEWMARQEREAARKVLLSFSDRQLRDMGIFRSQIDYILNNSGKRD